MESNKRRKTSQSKDVSSLHKKSLKPTINTTKRSASPQVASPGGVGPSVQSSANSESESESESEAEADADAEPEVEAELESEKPKTFKELGIVDTLAEACASLNYTTPTPIQREAIPLALAGRDVVGLAETGSGKTAAFALPILQALLAKPQPLCALVLAPTRELAYQISQTFEALGAVIALKVCTIVGGMDMVQQQIALAKRPHVVVATPGRMLDHLESTKGFHLRNLRHLVLDEADRLLQLEFRASIDSILKFLPRERHTLLFSATISDKVESLQRASLRDPVRVSVSSSNRKTVKNLIQNYIFVPQMYKEIYLVYLINEFAGKSIIIFTQTVNDTQRVAILLRALGFGAIPLHGQLSQSSRLGALNKFRTHSRDILVATDVAARGLDIPNVDLVLNYDLPSNSKTYVHRVGRTARAGKSGIAINLVTQYTVEIFLRIEKALGEHTKQTEYPLEKEDVMVFRARVEEAGIQAKIAMKELHAERDSGKKGAVLKGRKRSHGQGQSGGGNGKRRSDDMDAEVG